MRKLLLAGGLTAAAVAVVVGTASTNSNTIPDKAVGYGTSHVSGATATNITYNRTPDLKSINQVVLTFAGDLTQGQSISASFNGGTMTACTDVGAFTLDSGQSAGGSGTTQVTCDYASSPVLVEDVTGFDVAVTGDPIAGVTPAP